MEDSEDEDMTFELEKKKKKSSGKSKKSKGSGKNPRKDVILKTILRKMRKFFIKDFNQHTKYMTKKRRNFTEDLYKESLLNFVSERLPQLIQKGDFTSNDPINALLASPKELLLVMGLLIYPKEFYTIRNSMKFEDVIEKEFHSMLYSFTLAKTEKVG